MTMAYASHQRRKGIEQVVKRKFLNMKLLIALLLSNSVLLFGGIYFILDLGEPVLWFIILITVVPALIIAYLYRDQDLR